MSKILLVEDEEGIAVPICDYLQFEGHIVERVISGEEALLRTKVSKFDLLILDWNLPGISGLETLLEYRKWSEAAVIMLTANSKVESKMLGLDHGADDYLTKPFDMRELASRVKALLRRPSGTVSEKIVAGTLTIDLGLRSCAVLDQTVPLNAREFAVLEFLVRHQNQTYTVESLFENIWRSDSESGVEAVRQCVARLRKKLTIAGAPHVLKTVVGSGYCFNIGP